MELDFKNFEDWNRCFCKKVLRFEHGLVIVVFENLK